MTPSETNNLRSQRWLGNGPYSFAQRSRTLQNGLTDSGFAGKPVIAIVNTWSDVNTCHGDYLDPLRVFAALEGRPFEPDTR
jgi:dihydroxyacid dehydratase/phosphogluconate dehydratase